MFRRRPGTGRCARRRHGAIRGLARHRRPCRAGPSERRWLVSIVAVDAHAGPQLLHELVVLVEIDPHRHALHHLDEIARRVLRRQDRELRAGAGRERADRALERVVGERIDLERHRLADRDIGEIGFPSDWRRPRAWTSDDAEHRRCRPSRSGRAGSARPASRCRPSARAPRCGRDCAAPGRAPLWPGHRRESSRAAGRDCRAVALRRSRSSAAATGTAPSP